MYIEAVPNRNSPPCVLLRESYRDGKKVKKRTLANLTHCPPEFIEALRVLLKGGTAVKDLAEVRSPDDPGERLMVCKNPMLAQERARKRQDLLQATERELDKIVEATRRPKRRLRGQDRIGLRVGKVPGRFKVPKHFRVTITEDGFAYERHAERIAQEAALDGIYVIRTSLPAFDKITLPTPVQQRALDLLRLRL